MGIRLKGQTSGYVEIKAPATAADNTLTFPNGNGSSNQVLTTDGSGGLTFAAPQVSTDTTPQLGGNLDVNGNDIVTTSNGDVDLDPNGSGQVVFKGNATRGSGAVKLNCENNSHGILVKGPPHSAGANYTLTLPNDTGTSGQLLSTNGSGVTSWASVGGSTFEATASGAIANGDTIIVNANGTVSAVSGNNNVFGSEVQIHGSAGEEVSAVYDPSNDKVVVFYVEHDDANAGMAVVGTISGTSISFGTPVEFTSDTTELASCFDSTNNKVVVVYRDGAHSGRGKALVGTVSGTSISFGTAGTFNSANSTQPSAAYDVNRQKVVIVFRNDGDNDQGTGVIGTVSGTSISFGSTVAFETGSTIIPSTVYDPTNNKTVTFYKDLNDVSRGKAMIVGGSGTTFSAGTIVDFSNNLGVNAIKTVFDPDSGKIVIVYKETTNDTANALVCDASGSSLSFGTPVVFKQDPTNINIAYHQGVNKIAIIYEDTVAGGQAGRLMLGTVSGTTITFDPEQTFSSANMATQNSIVYDPDQDRLAIFYKDQSGSSITFNAKIYQAAVTNLSATNYIGIGDAAYSNGATATVQVVGSVDDAQSSLTPGQQYFVQNDGSLSTTAGSPSVVAGTAVAATKLIVKG